MTGATRTRCMQAIELGPDISTVQVGTCLIRPVAFGRVDRVTWFDRIDRNSTVRDSASGEQVLVCAHACTRARVY